MEYLPHIIKAMAEYGASPLTLVLIVMLYLFGVNMGAFPKLSGKKQEDPIPSWAQHLVQHFNHDTTTHHEATHQKLDELIRMEKDEHKLQQEFRDDIREVKYTLTNMKEYGVRKRES
jgi:hypothetical protein